MMDANFKQPWPVPMRIQAVSFLLRPSRVAVSLEDKSCCFEVRLSGQGSGSLEKFLEVEAGGAQSLLCTCPGSGTQDTLVECMQEDKPWE